MNNLNTYLKLFAALLILSITACKNTSPEAQNNNTEIGTPPSLSEKIKDNTIKLSKKEIDELKIKVTKVQVKAQNYKIVAPGVVEPHPKQVSIISAPIEGRIVKILSFDGDYVRKGSIIMQLESLTYGTLVADYVQAFAEVKYQKSQLDRIQTLADKNINSKSDLDKANADYKRAVASVNAAFSKLKAIGVENKDIEKMAKDEKTTPILNIYAPISGKIDQRQVENGESVNAYEKLARVVDPSKVLVKAYISPEDGMYVKTGDIASIMRREHPEKFVTGKIISINPGLDQENRSVIANISIRTENSWPLPGTNTRIEIETSTPARITTIPMESVTYDGNQPVVFVQKSEYEYEKRLIEISELRDKYALVTNGLQPNEKIAINQIFTLKALSRYEQFAE